MCKQASKSGGKLPRNFINLLWKIFHSINKLFTTVVYWTAGQTTKTRRYIKNIIPYFDSSTAMIVCLKGIQSVRVRTYLSSMAGDPFCELLRQPANNTRGVDRPCLSNSQVSPFAWETGGSLPFAWATSCPLPSVQNYRPYIVFSSLMQKYETSTTPHVFFCLRLVIWTYILRSFSGNLLIFYANRNICHSIYRP